jgi:3-oxoadipate enol-lactonase
MAELQLATGRRIFYDVTGNGSPLLLLMGAGESRKMWAWQIPALAPTFQVITMDNRDCGASEPETSPYSSADLANDAIALLDGLDLARAHVLGTSMGSMIALQLALDHPAQVDRLVLLSPLAGGLQLSAPPREAWSSDHADWIRGMFPMLAAPGYFDTHPGALEELVEVGRENRLTYDGVVRQIDAMGRFDVRSRLPEITAPTLLVVGERDPFIPLTDAQAFTAAIPNAQLVTVGGADIWLSLRVPRKSIGQSWTSWAYNDNRLLEDKAASGGVTVAHSPWPRPWPNMYRGRSARPG